jgi:hypothetical protein
MAPVALDLPNRRLLGGHQPRGEASLTFVMKVVKLGEGPAWRYDPPRSEIAGGRSELPRA